MPKQAKPLAPIQVARISEAGLHFVGEVAGLALNVSEQGARSWVLRATVAGKRREFGLGGFPSVTLADARRKARDAREAIAQGIDPIEAKRAALSAAKAAKAASRTFDQCAAAYIEAKSPEWKNAKHADQWRNTLTTYASPHVGALLIADVDVPHVVAAISPIWTTKPETANRVRQRIERVIDWATAQKMRSGPNPARWRGHLDMVLASPRKVRRVRHHPAVPVAEVGRFMRDLQAAEGVAARCLELACLTAARSGEARLAAWSEFDLQRLIWAVPASRMKRGRTHQIPLSSAAVALLKSLPRMGSESLVFAGARAGRPLSDMSLSAVMRRMGVLGTDGDGKRVQAVPHGLRSTFRDWASERTNHPRDAVEAALSHVVAGSATEAAYLRSDLFQRRIKLMDDWASFLARVETTAKVLPLRRRS